MEGCTGGEKEREVGGNRWRICAVVVEVEW